MIYRGLEITKNEKEYLIYDGDMLLKILSTKDYNSVINFFSKPLFLFLTIMLTIFLVYYLFSVSQK